MLLDLAKYSNLLVLLGTHLNHLLEESGVCGRQCLQGSYKAGNSKAKTVMEGSDVVGATDETVRVIGGAVETASSMDTGGAEVCDVEAGGIVSVESSPCFVGTGVDCVCSVCGGSRGATMGWAPGGAK